MQNEEEKNEVIRKKDNPYEMPKPVINMLIKII